MLQAQPNPAPKVRRIPQIPEFEPQASLHWLRSFFLHLASPVPELRTYIGISAWISLSISPARAKFSSLPSTALLISWPFTTSNKPSLFRTS
jgi:hypothetical protein